MEEDLWQVTRATGGVFISTGDGFGQVLDKLLRFCVTWSFRVVVVNSWASLSLV